MNSRFRRAMLAMVSFFAHPTLFGRAVDDGEIELVLGSVELAHEVEDHLIHLLGTTVGFVHFVDDHDGLQTNLQRFLQHESRLRHRPLESVNEQQTAVGHIQHALHLAAEVGVTRSVDDIDLCSFIIDADVLG